MKMLNRHAEHIEPNLVRKRSVVLSGNKTSVSLEEPFWQALHEIAQARGSSMAALITSIAQKRSQGNLSSALRVFVLEQFLAAASESKGACEKRAIT